MIEISPYILFAVGVGGLAFLSWYSGRYASKVDNKVEFHQMQTRERERIRRMAEMRAAYGLAKEELGEEPTVDQIFLTRDSLRKDKNGTT